MRQTPMLVAVHTVVHTGSRMWAHMSKFHLSHGKVTFSMEGAKQIMDRMHRLEARAGRPMGSSASSRGFSASPWLAFRLSNASMYKGEKTFIQSTVMLSKIRGGPL